MIDLAAIRAQSALEAARLGCQVSPHLPRLDEPTAWRSADEITERCLVLHALVAVSYGFSRESAQDWLTREGLVDGLSALERDYLGGGTAADDEFFRGLVESIWALLWAVGKTDRLDFAAPCPDDMVHMLPDLKAPESPSAFRAEATVRPRPVEELLAALDLAYCLHWSVTDAALHGARPPGRVAAWVVVERRRALEWVLSDDDWDDVSLDT